MGDKLALAGFLFIILNSTVRGPLSDRRGQLSAGSAKRTSIKDQARRGFY